MKIIANLKTGILSAYDKDIKISCNVRNELNKLRPLTDKVVFSIPEGKPIMPRQFPVGQWKVLRPQVRTDPYLAPYFIPTFAWQFLPVWSLENDHYKSVTGNKTRDQGYGLHYSTSKTTQGCIKIESKADLLFLVGKINETLDAGDGVILEVTNG